MTPDEFWKIIDDAREESSNSDEVPAAVQKTLEGLNPDDILGFYREFQRRMVESYRWDLWAIAYIVRGGCSDDGFDYFRGWLISKGRHYFESALKDPTRAADEPDENVSECEEMLYAADRAYESKTGEYPPKSDVTYPAGGPTGDPWEEDDLKKLYPELWERFFA
jgi:hypothetical protein